MGNSRYDKPSLPLLSLIFLWCSISSNPLRVHHLRPIYCNVLTEFRAQATFGFLAGLVPARRRPLAMYPVVLFYLILGWMVLMHPPLSFFYNLENPSE